VLVWPGMRMLGLVVCLGACWPALAARADIYSWVDADGGIHFTDVDPQKLEGAKPKGASIKVGTDVDGFGGQPPLVITMEGGAERRLYAVDVGDYDHHFRGAASHYRLPFAFLKAIAKVESNFNPRAVSNKAAKGMMQLIDGTARLVDVDDPFDPEQAIYGGARYLRVLANTFEGDLVLTAAAYNAGPEAVRRAGGVPNFQETQRYVERVLAMYRHYRGKE
jgi:soluble lytic murein transglycosylase-like protein